MNVRALPLAALTLCACSSAVVSSASSSGSGTSSSTTAAGSTTSTSTSASSSAASTTGGSHGASSGTGSTSSTTTAGSTSGSSTTTTTNGGTGSTGLTLGQSIDALVGVNGFIDDPQDKLQIFGTVREYHNWSVNDGNGDASYAGYPNNQLQFSLWGGFWDFDAYYTQLAQAGVTAWPAVQGGVSYLNDSAIPPVASGADPTQPASYVASADFLWQYAARYGQTQVSDSLLKLASGQTRSSGLGVLRYIENGNEPDNNWTHADGSPLFSAVDFAAKSSADYDGDQGRLGTTVGIKNADPNMKMVLAGLAMAGSSDPVTNAITYLEGIRTWAQTNRGGSFPADVINIHYYCFGPDGYGVPNPRPGKSPEDCGLTALLQQMVTYRNTNLPDKELWLTEFGYDTDPGSNLRAPAIGGNSGEIVQAQWLTRSILAIAESGIDRATVFVSRDGCTGSSCANASIQFTTSGVTTDMNSGFTPKPSWFYLSAFRHALAGLRFAGTRPTGRSDVRVDAFADASGHGAYVVWVPSSTAATASGFSLAVPGATSATQVQLVNQSATGSSTTLTISSGSVSVDVSETPIIVQVDQVR
ncbi:MAG: hypothetical protein JST54_12200 [Deltaproteobacteria bacterium]|nr:hypothetical protein [Deltaproteobacteria bacterium]